MNQQIFAVPHPMAKGAKRHGRSQVNPIDLIGNAELDSLIQGLLKVGDESNAETLTVVIPAGKTQTKHIERRFFARVKKIAPEFVKKIRQRIIFQAAKDSVISRKQKTTETKPIVSPGHVKQVNESPKETVESKPVTTEKRIIKTVFSDDDGDIAVMITEIRRLIKEAGIDEIHLRHDTDTVTLIGD